MITPDEIYTFFVSLTELSKIEQGVFLFVSTTVSGLLYLIKLSTGKISSKQWETFLLTTLLFILIPERFYDCIGKLIFN